MTTDRMLQFVTTAKAMPDKRKAGRRAGDFDEIYAEFSMKKAVEQAGRCSQCGVPFCQTHCPLQNNIPDWLMLTAEGRMEEAWEVSSATNTFPEICGRICPQDRLCEGNCVIEKGFESVTIGAVEKHITETAFEKGWVKPPKPVRERAESIGIIGAGPAGLAAADMLRRIGYQVEIYDRHDRVGGLLIYGIPNFKLEKHVVARREKLLRDAGVKFHLGCDVGGGMEFAKIRSQHEAVLIATGVYKARELDDRMKGADLAGIVPALDYLIAANREGLGDKLSPAEKIPARGRDVVVIGGGDTAMDCVRTAIRQKAKSVRCLYRRDRENMPGSMREVMNAEEEGVVFEWLTAPTGFKADGAAVAGVECVRIHLGQPDASGRRAPSILPGSEHAIKADMVIKALGFEPEDIPAAFGQKGLEVSRRGTIEVNWRDMMTDVEGVFAAGDIVRGASLVVWAVRDGRDAAEHIHKWLGRKAKAREVKIAS